MKRRSPERGDHSGDLSTDSATSPHRYPCGRNFWVMLRQLFNQSSAGYSEAADFGYKADFGYELDD
ncbi:MAG: hypothetical protein AAFR26_19285 [Cyanobacteria bacterium J06626_4]